MGGLVAELFDIALLRVFGKPTCEPPQITFGRRHGRS
jgi:hypothetical protein